MRSRVSLLIVTLSLLLNSGCATPSKALWRAGASRYGFQSEPRPMPKAPAEVEVYFKQEFGALEKTTSKRFFACGTTTVLRKGFLLEGPTPPERSWDALAHVTTEEFPRDDEASEIDVRGEFTTIFGMGTKPMDLFDTRLDASFREEALDRLRYFASQLGADAVIEVFATGAAEYHMWQGFAFGIDTRDTNHVIASGRVLDFRLRDVRLHGIAVRYD